MCGIAGIVGARPSLETVERMAARQRHRGPDGDGTWTGEGCALAHRRLAVIDTSDRGCQPMADASGRLQLVFNGEIYNFRNLRQQLEARGYAFVSDTDSEVILHGYAAWGSDVVERLRGMFSFAIWDAEQRVLFAARDRLGKKPFYFAPGPDTFTFASELQGVFADPAVPRDIDLDAIDAYLTWGYVPAPATGFASVRKLEPGHCMWVRVTAGKPLSIQTERYWALDHEPKLELSADDMQRRLRELVRLAVEQRLVADVPVGAFLSGGIDSSIVVAMMAQASGKPVKTFSIGYEEARWSELEHARRVAERWNTDHTEAVIGPECLEALPMLVRHHGEPYADSSALPSYHLAQLARRDVAVALTGDGGDESFAGYDRYRANALAARISTVPGGAALGAALGRRVGDAGNPKDLRRRLHRFLAAAGDDMPDRYGAWVGYFSQDEKRRLYGPALRPVLDIDGPARWFASLFEASDAMNPVDAAMAVDIRSYLPYDLLVKTDITTMATSLEARSPLLDQELMEFAARIPVRAKAGWASGKRILKETFSDVLPAEISRRGKMGFGVPVGEWLRGPLRPLIGDVLLGPDCHVGSYLDVAEIERLVAEHLSGRWDGSQKLWALLMLEMWHREVVAAPDSMVR